MRRAITAVLGTAALVGSTTLLAAPAVAAEPVTSCGTTVTGDAYLVADLTCSRGPGITVAGDGTLDMRGHTISGTPTPAGWASFGVSLVGEGRTAVRNGSVRHAVDGITVDRTGTKEISGVTVTDSGIGFLSSAIGEVDPAGDIHIVGSTFARNRVGIAATFFHTLTVTASSVLDSTEYGVLIQRGERFELSASQVSRTAGQGLVCFQTTCDIATSTFRGNGNGLDQFGGHVSITSSVFTAGVSGYSIAGTGTATVTRSVFADHVGYAVFSGPASTLELTRSRFVDNGGRAYTKVVDREAGRDTVIGNAFLRNGDGIVLMLEPDGSPADVQIGDNAAVANRGWGIFAPGATDLGDNTSRRNGKDPQCVGVVCAE